MLRKVTKKRWFSSSALALCTQYLLFGSIFATAPAGGGAAASISPIRDTGVITGDPSSKYRNYFLPKTEIQLATPNSKLLVGATINADFYWVRHAETLDNNVKEDERRQFRQRSDLYFLLRYGIDQEQDRSTVDMRFNLANTLYMRTNAKPSFYAGVGGASNAVGSPLDNNFSPIKVQFKEAWVQVNFDRLAKKMESNQHGLKVGYFPFLVGRGISLGDVHQGGVTYMGFTKAAADQYAPSYPPGILWHGEITKYSSYDLYFSPLVTEDITSAKSASIVNMQLPNESLLNRHIIAASIKLGAQFKDISKTMAIKDGVAMINPYWVYYNSPRQTVDKAADAPLNLHTFGFMAEVQAGGFEFNCEVAKQFGRQTVRERVFADPSDPKLYPSVQHFDPVTGRFRALPAAVAAQLPAGSVNPNRWFVNDNATPTGSDVYWADQSSDQRLAEHHPAYDLKLEGWMAVFDARYTFENYPLIVAVAGGYFSGDNYPYNDTVDKYFGSNGEQYHTVSTDGTVNIMHESEKPYRGFMPLRDYEYLGLWVSPLVMVNAGIVPRPKQLDLFDLSAHNDNDTLTNLVYLGAGFTIRPMKDIKKLRLNVNILAYWLDDDLRKWDKKATPPVRLVQNEGVLSSNKAFYDDLNIKGWLSNEAASKYLGWELNGMANYKITDNLDLSLRAGIFFPGQVFADLDGQPNNLTLVQTINALNPAAPGALQNKIELKGLGQDKAYGFYARIRYLF